MRTVTPGHASSAGTGGARSSRSRNSTPPATHSAAVTTGYSATKATRTSARVCISPLLAAASPAQRGEDDGGAREGRRRDEQSDLDRVGALDGPRAHDERGEPEHGAEHHRGDDPRAGRAPQGLELRHRGCRTLVGHGDGPIMAPAARRRAGLPAAVWP